MKKILFPIFLFLAACDSIDDHEVYDVSKAINAPDQLILTNATSSSLAFSWGKVDDAVQYGYNLRDAIGNNVVGGTTNETSVTISGLNLYSIYTLHVTAFPKLGAGMAQSAPVSIEGKTSFYAQVSDAECLCTSFLRDATNGHTYKGTINEDRSYDDYLDGWFGIFTIKNFYGSKGNLVFKVNRDYSITILKDNYAPLSASDYDADGNVKVTTGYSIPSSLKVLYIDESTSVFKPESGMLTFSAKLSNTAFKTETFNW